MINKKGFTQHQFLNKGTKSTQPAQVLKTGAGFTFLEVLLSITLFIMLSGFSIGVSRGLQIRNDIDVATNTVVQSLRRAQLLSQAVDGDDSWGLYINTGQIIIFKGSSYAGRDTNYDEVFSMPDSIAIAGVNEIVYSKFSGLPQSTGTISLKSIENDNKNITINSQGTINY